MRVNSLLRKGSALTTAPTTITRLLKRLQRSTLQESELREIRKTCPSYEKWLRVPGFDPYAQRESFRHHEHYPVDAI